MLAQEREGIAEQMERVEAMMKGLARRPTPPARSCIGSGMPWLWSPVSEKPETSPARHDVSFLISGFVAPTAAPPSSLHASESPLRHAVF